MICRSSSRAAPVNLPFLHEEFPRLQSPVTLVVGSPVLQLDLLRFRNPTFLSCNVRTSVHQDQVHWPFKRLSFSYLVAYSLTNIFQRILLKIAIHDAERGILWALFIPYVQKPETCGSSIKCSYFFLRLREISEGGFHWIYILIASE